MKVQIVDPPAYTPPYDHALCAALAEAGAEVELVTSRFRHGPVPAGHGYRTAELFYQLAERSGGGAITARPAKLAGHIPAMLRLRRHTRGADLVHFQWLTLPGLDAHLLPRGPLVWTVHDPPPATAPRRVAWRAAAARFDALIAHSEPGIEAIVERLGVPRERVHVIPHGAFEYLTVLDHEQALPDELAAVEGPVVLCFGLIRPYKGIDVLLEACRELEGAELWIVGRPMMALAPLERLASRCRAKVRIVPRFITDPEIPAYFRRADIVVLPYREADQSGVLYTALAFGNPVIATEVGGFPEVAAHGDCLRLVPPGDPPALDAALRTVLGDEDERARLATAARAAAAGPYSWAQVATRTLALYRELIDSSA